MHNVSARTQLLSWLRDENVFRKARARGYTFIVSQNAQAQWEKELHGVIQLLHEGEECNGRCKFVDGPYPDQRHYRVTPEGLVLLALKHGLTPP